MASFLLQVAHLYDNTLLLTDIDVNSINISEKNLNNIIKKEGPYIVPYPIILKIEVTPY